MTDITINGKKYLLDIEAAKRDELYMRYCQDKMDHELAGSFWIGNNKPRSQGDGVVEITQQ